MNVNFDKKMSKIVRGFVILLVILSFILIKINSKEDTIMTSVQNGISNKKIEWGIKRNDKHEQPDMGAQNKKILESNGGIAIGNKEDKYIYLTFDQGYEAGYTSDILKTLKENNVTATFFITAHYLNTQPELVKQMIDQKCIVGNQSPHALMDI